MDVAALLERSQSRADYVGQLEHVEILAARHPRTPDAQQAGNDAVARVTLSAGRIYRRSGC